MGEKRQVGTLVYVQRLITILGFGEAIKVLAPRLLVSRIRRRLMNANARYEDAGAKEKEAK